MALTKVTNTVVDIQDLGSALAVASTSLNSTIASKLNNTVLTGAWTPDNDGAGSGLNADMLDGYHASTFIMNDTNAVILDVQVAGSTVIESDGKIDWSKIKNAPNLAAGGGITNVTITNCGYFAVLHSSRSGDNVNFDLENTSNCACGNVCFLPEQEVRMADGSIKAIVDIDAGDEVIGQDGKPTVVIGRKITELNGRDMYSMAEGSVVTTSDHMLLTKDGWGCVNPRSFSTRVGADVELTNLSGDVVSVVKSSADMSPVAIQSDSVLSTVDNGEIPVSGIEAVKYDPSTEVYTLCTESGTYVLGNGVIADGMPQEVL